MKVATLDPAALRLLRRTARKGTKIALADGKWRLEGKASPREACDAVSVETLRNRGLLADAGDGALALTKAGGAFLRRSLATVDDFAAQHQERSIAFVADESGSHAVTLNHDESPLAWLRHRRDGRGRPLVDASEFAAGERLRSDYTRGQIMPRVTSNWRASVSGRGRDRGGAIELTEAAMGARRRVEHALEAVGPELSGLLVDFCCFLKGLEEIERERRWPARSAKVALRLGLAALARHYGLTQAAHGKAHRGKPLHWGADDYRPTIE